MLPFMKKRQDDSEGGTTDKSMELWRLTPTSRKQMKELSVFPLVGFKNCYGP